MQRSFVADCRLIEELEKRSASVPFNKGHLLFKQGEAPKGLYILKSGKAALVMAAENGFEVMQLAVGEDRNFAPIAGHQVGSTGERGPTN